MDPMRFSTVNTRKSDLYLSKYVFVCLYINRYVWYYREIAERHMLCKKGSVGQQTLNLSEVCFAKHTTS